MCWHTLCVELVGGAQANSFPDAGNRATIPIYEEMISYKSMETSQMISLSLANDDPCTHLISTLDYSVVLVPFMFLCCESGCVWLSQVIPTHEEASSGDSALFSKPPGISHS